MFSKKNLTIFFSFSGKNHDFFMYSISLQRVKIPQIYSGKCVGTPNNRKKGGHHHPSINGKLQKSVLSPIWHKERT